MHNEKSARISANMHSSTAQGEEEISEVLVECDKCHEKYWFTVVWGSDDFYHLSKGQYLHGCGREGTIFPVRPYQFREVSIEKTRQKKKHVSKRK